MWAAVVLAVIFGLVIGRRERSAPEGAVAFGYAFVGLAALYALFSVADLAAG